MSPLRTQMRVERVTTGADGREALEAVKSASVGDVIQYSATHTNRSSRRLLRIRFGIPIPHGMDYIEGSASPEGAQRVRLDADRDQMQWQFEQLEPGQSVTLRLRVRIAPDPTLRPLPPEPVRPQLRRAPG